MCIFLDANSHLIEYTFKKLILHFTAHHGNKLVSCPITHCTDCVSNIHTTLSCSITAFMLGHFGLRKSSTNLWHWPKYFIHFFLCIVKLCSLNKIIVPLPVSYNFWSNRKHLQALIPSYISPRVLFKSFFQVPNISKHSLFFTLLERQVWSGRQASYVLLYSAAEMNVTCHAAVHLLLLFLLLSVAVWTRNM